MIYSSLRKARVNLEDWHSWFAWRPVRIDDTRKAWLHRLQRKLVVDDEGNWAGGYRYHWEYRL